MMVRRNGVDVKFDDRLLKKKKQQILVKNNIPNYDYVSDFVKGLRKLTYWKLCIFPSRDC